MVQTLNPEGLKGVLRAQAQRFLETGEPQQFVAQFEGPPGIGKSESPRQVVQELKEQTHPETGEKLKVGLVDTRLSYHEPSDFSIPVKTDEGGIKFVTPERFTQLGQEHDVLFWFLDEITHAKPPVQAVAFKMVLDRVIGYQAIPDNVIMITAGNGVEEGGLHELAEPLQDRFVKYRVMPEYEQWVEYAQTVDMHSAVIGYIEWQKRQGLIDMSQGDKPTTPRGWERVSNILRNEFMDDVSKWASIDGSIAQGHAQEFKEFYRLKSQVPSVDDVLKNPEKLVEIYEGDRRDLYFSLRSVIQDEATPQEILGLVQQIDETEIQMQVLKPLINRISNADSGTKYAKLTEDDKFMEELIEMAANMSNEQRQIISEVLGE